MCHSHHEWNPSGRASCWLISWSCLCLQFCHLLCASTSQESGQLRQNLVSTSCRTTCHPLACLGNVCVTDRVSENHLGLPHLAAAQGRVSAQGSTCVACCSTFAAFTDLNLSPPAPRRQKPSFPLLAPISLFSFNPCMTSLISFVKFLTADLYSVPLLFLVFYGEEFPIYFLLHDLAFACPSSQSSFLPSQPSFFSMALWLLCVGRKMILNSSQLSVTDSCSNSFFQLFCFVIIFSFVKLALEIIK